jgi:3-deoxy-manno-octulosonate cytidylyltransferase (CMP-KDO synthetase)
MRILIVIPARLQATRLPNKPLAPLGGLPLVVRVARQAQKARRASGVIIATDAPEVREAAAKHGLEARLTSAAHQSGTDRVAEIARGTDCDAVLNVQGDEPFIEPRDLDDLCDALAKGAEMVTLWAPLERGEHADPNVVKVVTDDAGRALYFSRATIPFTRDGGNAGQELGKKHVGVYGYRRGVLERLVSAPVHPLEACEKLEQLRALALGVPITVLAARTRARGIDTPDDLRWAQERIDRLGEAAFP